MPFAFEDASYLGQVARLRRVARVAAERFGIGDARLSLLRHWMNATFRADHRTGRYAVRVHVNGYHTRRRIDSELQWMSALTDEPGLAVPEPRVTGDGCRVTVVEDDRLDAARHVSVMRWVGGRFIRRRSVRPVHYRRVGVAMATMHNRATGWSRPESFEREWFDVESMGATKPCALIDPRAWDRLKPDDRRIFEEVLQRGRAAQQVIGTGPNRFNLIHSDLHFGNVLFQKDRLGVIDFDDCSIGPLVADIAITLCGTEHRPGHQQWRQALLAGYRTVRDLSSSEESCIDAYMAMRDMQLSLWVLWNADFHPSFRKIGYRRVEGAIQRLKPFLRGEPQPD